MIEDKDMFAWKKAIREPVDKKTLPLAVKTASLIGHNIYKCLRCQKKLGFCCAYDVPYDNTISFKKTDTCKAFMLYDDDIIIGVITLNVTSKNGRIVAMRAVKGDEDLMMITNGGTVIRMPLEQIKIVGRNTQGVKVIRLDDEKQRVSSITIIPHEDISGEEEVAKSDNEEVTEEAKTPAENE